MDLQRQLDCLQNAIKTLCGKDVLNKDERKKLEYLSVWVTVYTNPCEIAETDELKKVDRVVYEIARKYDLENEIAPILDLWI